MRGHKQCLVHDKHPLNVDDYSEHHREMLSSHQDRNQEMNHIVDLYSQGSQVCSSTFPLSEWFINKNSAIKKKLCSLSCEIICCII